MLSVLIPVLKGQGRVMDLVEDMVRHALDDQGDLSVLASVVSLAPPR